MHILVIQELNSNTKTKIKIFNGLTKKVLIATGITQGDSLNPTLFNTVTEQILKNVNEVYGGNRMFAKDTSL